MSNPTVIVEARRITAALSTGEAREFAQALRKIREAMPVECEVEESAFVRAAVMNRVREIVGA